LAFWRAGGVARWRAFAAPLAGVIIAGALAFAAGFCLSLVRPGEAYAFAYPEPTRAWCTLFGLLGGVAGAWLAGAGRNSKLAGAAAMFWFASIGFIASILVSGISILFALPALVYSAGLAASLAWKPAHAIGGWLAAFVVLSVWAPLLYLVELALGFDIPFVFAILITLMLLAWIGPLGEVHGDRDWRSIAAVLALAALGGVIASALVPAESEARPRPLNISYFHDTTGERARVIAGTAERALPSQLAGVFSPELILPGDRFETWAAPASREAITPPGLVEITASAENGERMVRGRLIMNGAYRALIRIPLEARPLSARVNGAEADFADTGGERRDYMTLACQGRACDGASVEIVLEDGQSDAQWYMIGQFPGRASPAAEVMRARRPTSATPIQFGDSVITLSEFKP
jgi:hypothetical protein